MRDIAREAGITDAAIYYHFQSKRDLLEALVEEKGFLEGLQNLERVTADLPLDQMLIWMARGAIELMDENREFLRLIIMEGLGGDEAGLDQYRRLIDLWQDALTTVLARYQEKGELPGDSLPSLARQIIYLILMSFIGEPPRPERRTQCINGGAARGPRRVRRGRYSHYSHRRLLTFPMIAIGRFRAVS